MSSPDAPTVRRAQDRLLLLAAIFGVLGVGGGAFGAHALEGRLTAGALATFETAIRYQLVHALALLALAGVAQLRPRVAVRAGMVFAAGVVLFSGSLYLFVFTGVGLFAAVTPIGGVCFLLGWGVLGWSTVRAGRSGPAAGPGDSS